MIRLYAIAGLVVTLLVGGFGSYSFIEHQKNKLILLQYANIALENNVKALERKIEVDKKVSADDTARAVEDAKRLTTFKEKSSVIIQGTKSPGHVALDRDATQRVRDIFAQH